MPDLTIDPVLSPGERLELHRRRLGVTQQQYAGLVGVTVHRVRLWERDLRRVDQPNMAGLDLELHEWCWLRRRRAGWTLEDLSARLGLAVSWLHRAERGELGAGRIGALVDFWRREATR